MSDQDPLDVRAGDAIADDKYIAAMVGALDADIRTSERNTSWCGVLAVGGITLLATSLDSRDKMPPDLRGALGYAAAAWAVAILLGAVNLFVNTLARADMQRIVQDTVMIHDHPRSMDHLGSGIASVRKRYIDERSVTTGRARTRIRVCAAITTVMFSAAVAGVFVVATVLIRAFAA